jgi:hypothetical protein
MYHKRPDTTKLTVELGMIAMEMELRLQEHNVVMNQRTVSYQHIVSVSIAQNS